MDFFINTTEASHSYRVLWTKEELMNELSQMVDKAIESGCTFFDLLINTDVDCRVK